jgi:hypothetical protein
MPSNTRVYYAIYSAQVSKCGEESFTAIKGLQAAGCNTKFNLEQAFEVGQGAIYANIENIPDVELTTQKVLDGYPLIYHLATKGATSPTLQGRSNVRCTVGLSVFSDQQDSASGTPITQCEMSGMYVSSLTYTFPTEGNCTEDVTLVGNNKTWLRTFTAPAFANTDSPVASGGIQRRQNVVFGSGTQCCLLPKEIPGINPQGYNIEQAGGSFAAHIQQARLSTNLGREALYELGRRGVYARYAQFPVQVQADFDVLGSQGDGVEALEDAASNITDQTIVIKTLDGTVINLGAKNKLTGVTMTGGNAGQQGGNQTMTYSYITFNDFTVTHPADPSGL